MGCDPQGQGVLRVMGGGGDHETLQIRSESTVISFIYFQKCPTRELLDRLVGGIRYLMNSSLTETMKFNIRHCSNYCFPFVTIQCTCLAYGVIYVYTILTQGLERLNNQQLKITHR